MASQEIGIVRREYLFESPRLETDPTTMMDTAKVKKHDILFPDSGRRASRFRMSWLSLQRLRSVKYGRRICFDRSCLRGRIRHIRRRPQLDYAHLRAVCTARVAVFYCNSVSGLEVLVDRTFTQ
jgi:hypothetical protein